MLHAGAVVGNNVRRRFVEFHLVTA